MASIIQRATLVLHGPKNVRDIANIERPRYSMVTANVMDGLDRTMESCKRTRRVSLKGGSVFIFGHPRDKDSSM